MSSNITVNPATIQAAATAAASTATPGTAIGSLSSLTRDYDQERAYRATYLAEDPKFFDWLAGDKKQEWQDLYGSTSVASLNAFKTHLQETEPKTPKFNPSIKARSAKASYVCKLPQL